MWRRRFLHRLPFLQTYDTCSNKYDTWVVVKSINIGAYAENGYEKSPGMRLGDESKFGLYTVARGNKLS
jgi:hypothetical protein